MIGVERSNPLQSGKPSVCTPIAIGLYANWREVSSHLRE
jgi:hypothetical protein